MRVAALYDIHGNLPALDAVLEEVRFAGVDRVVIGGDVLPGPMPLETLDRLLNLEIPAQFIYGNGELAILAQLAASHPADVTYWGTTNEEPLPEPLREIVRWTARQLSPGQADTVRTWPTTLQLDIPPFGRVLMCHATPRSETECFTRLTPEDRLLPVFQGLGVNLVVCGHTHMPFDRMIGAVRVVNAGSVGMPFGRPGADWLLLDGNVQLRHTSYDLVETAARVRGTLYPQADEFAERSILHPPAEDDVLRVFTDLSFR